MQTRKQLITIAKKVQTKHLIVILILALGAMLLLFWSTKSQRVYYWQDKLFSPGNLNYKHLSDRGKQITCQDCHRIGQVLNNKSCVKCHSQQSFMENAPLLADAHRVFNKEDRCLRCHDEHGGTYTMIGPGSLNPKAHREIPYNTNKCITCHDKAGKKAHPSLIESKCTDCHKNYSWSSTFNHLKNLSKAKSAPEMLALCQECHTPNHHYNQVTNTETLTGCIFCHELWGKNLERKDIPFPIELFKKMKIDPRNFKFSPSRTN